MPKVLTPIRDWTPLQSEWKQPFIRQGKGEGAGSRKSLTQELRRAPWLVLRETCSTKRLDSSVRSCRTASAKLRPGTAWCGPACTGPKPNVSHKSSCSGGQCGRSLNAPDMVLLPCPAMGQRRIIHLLLVKQPPLSTAEPSLPGATQRPTCRDCAISQETLAQQVQMTSSGGSEHLVNLVVSGNDHHDKSLHSARVGKSLHNAGFYEWLHRCKVPRTKTQGQWLFLFQGHDA